MQAATQTTPVSQKKVWTGRIITALPALLLILSGTMKIMRLPSVIQGFAHAGIPEGHAIPLGIVEISCAVVYLIPRTTVLGAILMTAYLGGATATNVRVGDPATVMTVLLGVLVWLGLYLRDERLRALLPLRS